MTLHHYQSKGALMSNPTDTNQSSEDKLTKIIDRVYLYGMNGGLGYGKFDNELSPNDAKTAIQALIRTEKLKTKMDLLKTIRRSYPKKQTLLGNAQSKLTLADIDRLIGEIKMEAEL